MIKTIEKTDLNRYWIVVDTNSDVSGFGKLMNEQMLNTGQPTLYSFLTEDEMILKLNEITGSEEYYLESDYYENKDSIS
tara:strand:+ start:1981 stop:2217 length:237 start_codon:yes stop_codon:yes gene_type:complete